MCTHGYSSVGNGYCNDDFNNADCNYDGGDCCLFNIKSNQCTECNCHLQETCAAGFHPLVGDGYCHDETNNGPCNYDNGDCCSLNINSEQCTECICHHQETCAAGVTHRLVGDGYCHDESNNAECSYDGGDCCGACINSEHCTECQCLGGETGNAIPNTLVGNGYCNYETNNAECNYDDGECCVNVNTENCLECQCLGGGTITSPGYPEQNYDNNLDLYWLIQVPIGQTIEINFISFDVESHSSCR